MWLWVVHFQTRPYHACSRLFFLPNNLVFVAPVVEPVNHHFVPSMLHIPFHESDQESLLWSPPTLNGYQMQSDLHQVEDILGWSIF